MSINRYRLKHLENEGHKGALRVQKLLQQSYVDEKTKLIPYKFNGHHLDLVKRFDMCYPNSLLISVRLGCFPWRVMHLQQTTLNLYTTLVLFHLQLMRFPLGFFFILFYLLNRFMILFSSVLVWNPVLVFSQSIYEFRIAVYQYTTVPQVYK